MKKVGKCKLSDILKKRKMSQQELANRIGTTRQQISKYVTNKQYMTVPVAMHIAEILEVSLEDLYVLTFENDDES